MKTESTSCFALWGEPMCSGGGGPTAGAGGGAGSGGGASDVYPAPHPAAPQLVLAPGGKVLTAPHIVPVHHPGIPPAVLAELDGLYAALGSSTYFAGAVGEYGVGPAIVAPPIYLGEAAPPSLADADIRKWLVDELETNDGTLPPPDANTLYVIDYPSKTDIAWQGRHSCQDFRHYHAETALDAAHGGLPVVYVTLPDCGPAAGLGEAEALTTAAAAAILAAATNPLPQSAAAYSRFDEDHLVWASVMGSGEVDACNGFYAPVTYSDLPFTVPRTWSNAAALGGHDPCVPAPSGAYFNAVPVLDSLAFPGAITTLGCDIPICGQRNVELDLFSDADTGGPFDLQVVDPSGKLTFSLDQPSGNNGDKRMLTIGGQVLSNQMQPFLVLATRGQRKSLWVGLVTQQN